MTDNQEPVPLPLDGVLDLHSFRPEDVKEVVLEYLLECQARRIQRVRIVHGKGIGHLRRAVHALLNGHPGVAEFHVAGSSSGAWGATIVHLKIYPD